MRLCGGLEAAADLDGDGLVSSATHGSMQEARYLAAAEAAAAKVRGGNDRAEVCKTQFVLLMLKADASLTNGLASAAFGRSHLRHDDLAPRHPLVAMTLPKSEVYRAAARNHRITWTIPRFSTSSRQRGKPSVHTRSALRAFVAS